MWSLPVGFQTQTGLKMTFPFRWVGWANKKGHGPQPPPIVCLRNPLRVSPSHLPPIGRWRTWWCLAIGNPQKTMPFWSQKNGLPFETLLTSEIVTPTHQNKNSVGVKKLRDFSIQHGGFCTYSTGPMWSFFLHQNAKTQTLLSSKWAEPNFVSFNNFLLRLFSFPLQILRETDRGSLYYQPKQCTIIRRNPRTWP